MGSRRPRIEVAGEIALGVALAVPILALAVVGLLMGLGLFIVSTAVEWVRWLRRPG